MNRFFRSALFPLIVIAALVWLATQTLVSHGKKTDRETYSQLIQTVQNDPQAIQSVVFGDALHNQSNYLNLADNLCDPSHVSFVHSGLCKPAGTWR